MRLDFDAAAYVVPEGALKLLTMHDVRMIVEAALGNTDLFSWCPDCNGKGIITTMSSGPDLDETSRSCGRCGEFEGMVQVWPVKEDSDD